MKKITLLLLLLALVCSACRPDVESCFTSTVNGANVTFSSACAIEAVAYTWNFGDGSSADQGNPTHVYAQSGTYTVSLRVEDKKGKSSTTTSTVTVLLCPSCIHGQCVSDTCQCDAGYDGIHCDSLLNEKFTGTYASTETCTQSGAAPTYPVVVSPVTGTSSDVHMVGLWEVPATPVVATVQSDGLHFTIARQPLNANFDIASTDGTINSSGAMITLRYTIYPQGSTTVVEVCTAVLLR